ncbi:pyridoxal phosphate-dependent aminotransferase [Pelorhabdus rhamnosifermentans]|uniref:pyridoxal phosphate-dependent aminotransferase n=1 Tax=Pelorhabdus rhamnosifermentans TaxID=2772457 RepID=UPI001C060C5D|nr:pyridoxal phosphate-dependent aminotransferase [Pelorhabdus rhamnosifermentans]
MEYKLAKRMDEIPFSGIRKVFEQVAELSKQGKNIINLCVGRPDFDTPVHIKEAAVKALQSGQVHYTSNYGLERLRSAIVKKLYEKNGLTYQESQVIVTIGANEGVALSMMANLNPGDEVIIVEPAWAHYRYCAKLAGAVPVVVQLKSENYFQVTVDDFKKVLTNKTKMIVINTPNNPTGTIFSEKTLADIARLAVENNLLVLSDEIYEYLNYGEQEHISIASLPGMLERTIVLNGFSKAYAMDGWRLGYIAAPSEIVSGMIRVHQYTTTCANTFAQFGAIAALEGPQDMVWLMRDELKRRRDLVVAGINAMLPFKCHTPPGAFYLFFDSKALGISSVKAAQLILEKTGVAMVPGSAFGTSGEGYLRLSYASSYESLEEALNRLQKFIVTI